MHQLNTVVFDLGGVLIDWNPEYVYRELIPDEKQRKWFFQHVCTSDWNEEQDAGRPLQEGTEILVRAFPEHEKNIRAFYGRWQDMLGGPIPGSVEILKHLREKTDTRLYALTNWSAETFPIALNIFDFLHWFDGRLVSGEEKTRKPFPDIYQKLIERFNIDPLSSIYVDDNVRNIFPARELGFTTIHFIDPGQFKFELQKKGIPV
jgi:2-haloacid dehalogenase